MPRTERMSAFALVSANFTACGSVLSIATGSGGTPRNAGAGTSVFTAFAAAIFVVRVSGCAAGTLIHNALAGIARVLRGAAASVCDPPDGTLGAGTLTDTPGTGTPSMERIIAPATCCELAVTGRDVVAMFPAAGFESVPSSVARSFTNELPNCVATGGGASAAQVPASSGMAAIAFTRAMSAGECPS